MKKTLLLLALTLFCSETFAQIIAKGISPTSIATHYDFTWSEPGNNWGSPDLNIVGNYVQDTLVLVDDGTVGNNATYGNPLSAEGCAASPANAYAGKIAILYRNTCDFGLKALNAQQAGAVGVIIINREEATFGILGGVNGLSVTIPVIHIKKSDGLALLAEMLNGPVEFFIGNKAGVFPNDLNLSKSATLVSPTAAVPALLAQNGSEFSFEMGAMIKNIGSINASGISLNAKVFNPSGATVYDEQVSNLSISVGDSVEIYPGMTNILPNFTLASYPIGQYKIQYSLLSSVTDDDMFDNIYEATFDISDSLYAFAPIDNTTGLPINTGGFRPSTNNISYSTCLHLYDPNLSRLQVEGVYFASTPGAATPFDLTNTEIVVSVSEWTTSFVDLDDPNFGIDLVGIQDTIWYYPADLPGQYVYVPFSSAVDLQDNARYLVCVQTSNTDLFFAYNNQADYTWNNRLYRQPLFPIENDGNYFALGFGPAFTSAIAVKVGQNTVGLEERNLLQGKLYPNPTHSKFAIELDVNGIAKLSVVDNLGKKVIDQDVIFVNGKTIVEIDNLVNGIYQVSVETKDGAMARFSLMKN